ncbi:MAG: GNAT family N-acetyltransferase [Eubacteriaceae bacterium]|nr:GNAT family N-acetyltransferase [Eubacteriaceae bacterium]
METVIKHFDELSAPELFEILRLRVAVFVVEQNCPYQEIDEADRLAYHVCLMEEGKIAAYCRVLPKGATLEDNSLGRVIAVKRRQGYGSRVVREGIKVAREKFAAETLTIEAQVYAREFYEKLGFVKISEEFSEDGIPHILMRREAN